MPQLTLQQTFAKRSRDSDSQEHNKKRQKIADDTHQDSGSPDIEPLQGLLNFDGLATHEEIFDRMGLIAKSLLSQHTLEIKSDNGKVVNYEFIEVEFYLLKNPSHMDPFTHGEDEQRYSGRWYFHRVPQYILNIPSFSPTDVGPGGYKGGSRKGVDLTIGGTLSSPHFTAPPSTKEKEIRGGILIRSLRRTTDKKLISGPSLVVDEILRSCGTAMTVAELVDEKLQSTAAFTTETPIPAGKFSCSVCPRPGTRLSSATVYTSPRVGLELSHKSASASPTNPRVIFVQKPYRFFTHPELLTVNGRAHTFVGIYNFLTSSPTGNKKPKNAILDQLCRITGLKRNVAERYFAHLTWGQDHGELRSFIGSAGKGVSSSPESYLKMMGTLKRLRGSNGQSSS